MSKFSKTVYGLDMALPCGRCYWPDGWGEKGKLASFGTNVCESLDEK
jgi:hypothetical protein